MVHHGCCTWVRTHQGGSRARARRQGGFHGTQRGALDDPVERYSDRILELALDLTDAQQVADVVSQAHRHFGLLDVVLNNTGYALVGAIEEAGVNDVKAEFETYFFSMLRVIQAVSGGRRLRHQGDAHRARRLCDRFRKPRVAEDLRGLEAYAALRQQVFARGAAMEFGEPQAVLQIVDADKPPFRLFLGTEGMPMVPAAYTARLAEWAQWVAVSNAAQGTSVRQAIAV